MAVSQDKFCFGHIMILTGKSFRETLMKNTFLQSEALTYIYHPRHNSMVTVQGCVYDINQLEVRKLGVSARANCDKDEISNLIMATNPVVREIFLRKALETPRLFGSTGSRLATRNSEEYNALETRLSTSDDVIIYDELIHASCVRGSRSLLLGTRCIVSLIILWFPLRNAFGMSSANTPKLFTENLLYLESLSSMDGDLCPLAEIVQLVEDLVPAGHAHIVVDEAHTSGICGPNGSGYVSLLGLHHRVHTRVHTFRKAWGFHGAVVVTSPIVREYIVHSAKCVIFSTAMPYTDVYALQARLDVISSDRGQEVKIWRITYGSKGMQLRPSQHPAVRKPRIRMIVHARNTEEDIDSFVNALVQWTTTQGQDGVPAVVGSSVDADREYMKARARL
ncbi:pyridoxal phosphate-dependent transferase [Melanogaster broomeanus]|nr:pyridoxal phosphate-dependent transferase [Melanogaster broomeanus]